MGRLALFLLLSCAFGCEGATGQALSAWTLHVDGRSQPVQLPVHLDELLPKRVGVYRLSATIEIDPQLDDRALDLVLAPDLESRGYVARRCGRARGRADLAAIRTR